MTSAQKNIGSKVALAAIVFACAVGIYLSPLRQSITIETLRSLIGQMRGFWYGPIFFMLLYAAGCVFFLPATLFILLGGVIWGWVLGGTYALIGGALGAMASFLLARYVGGDVVGRLGRVGERVDSKLEEAGFTAIMLLRLVPLLPFAIVNYGAGLARVRTRDFFWGTLIGVAPAHFVVAYSADALLSGTLTREDAFQRIALVGLLIAVVVGVPMLLRKRVEKAVSARKVL